MRGANPREMHSVQYVAFQHAAADDAAIDIALNVHADTLGAGMIGHHGFQILDKGVHASVSCAAHAPKRLLEKKKASSQTPSALSI